MATGDANDMAGRINAVLPQGWFPDDDTNEQGVVAGFGTMWAGLYSLLMVVLSQTRIATAYGFFLDLISTDYFGSTLPRLVGEGDAAFSARIRAELLRQRVTRAAMVQALTDLLGQVPTIFEPWNTSDTGGWDTGAMGWDTAGKWGSLSYPDTVLIDVPPQLNQGIPNIQGWGDGTLSPAIGGWDQGAIAWQDQIPTVGVVTDADIYQAVNRSKPEGVQVLVRIGS